MALTLRTRLFVSSVLLLLAARFAAGDEPVGLPAPESLDITIPDVPGNVLGRPPVYGEPQEERPAVSIGGPYGVIMGSNNGLRIGGPNGVQFGGGAGARFGGPYGVQFGGGEGVRIGPRTYGPRPDYGLDNPASYAPQPTTREAGSTTIHLPQTAAQAIQIQINGEETQISPGETISLDAARGFTLRIARPNGRYGFRRSWTAGNYEFIQTRRGWMLSQTASAPESVPTEGTSRAEPFLQLEAPAFESLPAPADQP